MKLKAREKCPFCENNNFNELYDISYNNKKLKEFLSSYYKNDGLIEILRSETYQLNECKHCFGIFQKNIPDETLNQFIYDELISREESFNKKISHKSDHFIKYYRDAKLIEKLLNKKNQQIKILEFGCGWGFWAKFMKMMNFSVETCEISSSRIEYLTKNNILNHRNLDLIKNKYDIIFSDQVMEHVSEPYTIIKKLSHLLNDGGCMIHRFPTSFLFKFNLNKSYIPKKDCAHPLEHLNIYNKKCIIKIAHKLNLKKINLFFLKGLPFTQKLASLKNELLFNSIILKK